MGLNPSKIQKRTFIRLILIFILQTLAFISIRAETIYLKNGSIIHGTIIEEIPQKKYTVETDNGSIIIFNYEDIEKIIRKPQNELSEKINSLNPKYKGFVGNEFGFTSFFSYLLYTTQGAYLDKNHKFYLGGGIGLGLLKAYSEDEMGLLIPIYVDGRYDFNKNSDKGNAYIDIKLGYLLLEHAYFQPGVGYRWGLKNNKGINAGLGILLFGGASGVSAGACINFSFDW